MKGVTAYIDTAALVHNARRIREMAPGSRLVAVVKANGYGHGLVEVARALKDHADAFAVSRLTEALELRAHGVTLPVVLLEGFYNPEDLPLISHHSFLTAVHDLRQVEMLEKARGGVLFIDEAYALGVAGDLGSDLDDSGTRRDFGPEAIDTLVKEMEDHRNDPIVIMAGYPVLMDRMLSVNPGLKDRVGFTIRMEDYSADELGRIALKMLEDRGYVLTDGAWERLQDAAAQLEGAKGKDFANARLMRKLVERCIFKQNVRTAGYEIELCDVEAALADGDFAEKLDGAREERSPIGFVA